MGATSLARLLWYESVFTVLREHLQNNPSSGSPV